jgi:glycosyltransferase involved in cell wall biosynthesis
MICGSCLRDNRLAATLIEQGRDVVVVPMYTPLKVDEADTGKGRVYYGGINVALQQTASLFRRTPGWLDAALDVRPLLRAAGRFSSSTGPDRLGSLTVSVLKGEHGRQAKELDKLLDALRELKPDVVNLPNLMFVGMARRLKTELNAAILCTLSGEDVFLDKFAEPHRSQAFELIREAGPHVDGYVSLTKYYAIHAATHFGLPADRVHHVPMGIRVEDFLPAEGTAESPPTIGYFARICADKGFGVLCEAFAELASRGRDCRLRAGGYLGKLDRPHFAQAVKMLRSRGLASRFEYVGEVDRAGKVAFFQSVQLLCHPGPYPEAKGLSILEALAAGVPVVLPRHGSYPELVVATDGGLLYEPGDAAALVSALERLMDDADERRSLGRAGAAAVRERFNDRVMADRMWELYEHVTQTEPRP